MGVPKLNRSQFIPIALIVAVSALAYLPGLLQASIYRDDWYYVMDRLIGGAGVFQAMFSIDRPARGPFFELYYQLFGITPLPYHLASYAWRLLSGLAAFWLFNLLWPGQRRAATMMAVLFSVFPGYLHWMEGFEDQPAIASLCLETLSIALTLKAIGSKNTLARVAAWAGSFLTGWAYLALVDYALGMEVFRLLCVFVMVRRAPASQPFPQQVWGAVRAWAIAALIPAGFLGWRLFIFQNERPQTDVGRQLGLFAASPITTAAEWLVRFLQSFADVSAFAWVTPLIQDFFGLRLKQFYPGVVLVLLAAGASYLAWRLLDESKTTSDELAGGEWTREAIYIGLLGVAAGVVPIILANRYVDFQRYSHYALPASLAAAVLLSGALFSLKSRAATAGIGTVLIASAVAAHYAYSMQVVQEERTISTFWHQVAWRVPAFSPQTTLFVNYPGVAYVENVDAVQGPANFVYFPNPTGQNPVTYPMAALPQSEQSVTDVLVGKSRTVQYRTHQGLIDFERLLVMSQPTLDSCVRVINGQAPLFSADDPSAIRVTGGFSQIAQVLKEGKPLELSPVVFGPEPPHEWCYYFEKADLALQSGDWQQIARLGQQVSAAGLHADDWVEWTPFLQAYAYLGDASRFTDTAHRLAGDPFAKQQACATLRRMQQAGSAFSAKIQSQIDQLVCLGE